MPSESNASKMEGSNGDSDASNSNERVSTKPTNDKQQRKRSGDTSTSTTNEPSSASTSIVGARHPRALPVATAAAAATSTVPLSGKKPRRAGFREQFLQKLRVMLDRESQNDDAPVHWSTDGSSFVVADQTQFEEEIIPTYFGNAIVFASFLRKLQRWGFIRVSSKRSGRYEFSSPTFKRIDSSAPAASAASGAATTTNVAVNDGGGGGASIRSPQQQQQQQQQVMVQRNQQPVPAPNQLPRRADASDIADLISNIQRQRSTQQPSTSSPQPGPNQYSNQMNIADVNNVLQHITGGLFSGQNSVPNQQPVPNYTSQLNNVARNNHLQSLQQWQHPYPALNLLNSALQSLTRGPTPSAQAMGQYPPLSAQSSAVHALMSLSGMLPQSPILNTTPVALGMSTPASSQPNDITHVLSLLQMLQRVVEEEYQRKAQVEAMQTAIMETIGRILGQGFHNNNIAQPQQVGAPPPSRQSFGSNNNIAAQPNQERAPQPSIGSNVQVDSIAAILLAAQRGDATEQPEENARAQSFGPVINKFDSEDDSDEDSEEDEHQSTSAKKRKSSPDDEDQYDADDDSWNERLRPRRKSPP